MDELGWWSRFALASLACWRITHLLASEDGPGEIVLRLRRRLGDSLAGRAMDCFYCLSFWVAGPVALLQAQDVVGWLLSWLGLSGAACLIERTSARASHHE